MANLSATNFLFVYLDAVSIFGRARGFRNHEKTTYRNGVEVFKIANKSACTV
jgi:hypothetical protein